MRNHSLTSNKAIESSVVIIVLAILLGAALIWSEPSNRVLVLVGTCVFLCLFFISTEKLLLMYLVISPVVDLLIPFFTSVSAGGGRFGPQTLLRGGLVFLLASYFVLNKRNPLFVKAARPMFIFLLLIAIVTSASSRGVLLRRGITALAQVTFWMLLLLVVADMVVRGKMELKKIYRYVMISTLIFVASTTISSDFFHMGKGIHYGAAATSGMFVNQNLAVSLSMGLAVVLALATRERRKSRFLLLTLFATGIMLTVMRTFVRTGYVTIISTLFALYLMVWRYGKDERLWRQIYALVVVSIIVIGAAGVYASRHTALLYERFSDFSGSGRIYFWRSALKTYADYPIDQKLVGGGYAIGRIAAGRPGLDIHNSYLQVLIEVGLVGLCMYLWVFVSLWRQVKSAAQKNYVPLMITGAVIIANLVSGMVTGTLTAVSSNTYFSFLVGGAIGHYGSNKMRRQVGESNADDNTV